MTFSPQTAKPLNDLAEVLLRTNAPYNSPIDQAVGAGIGRFERRLSMNNCQLQTVYVLFLNAPSPATRAWVCRRVSGRA